MRWVALILLIVLCVGCYPQYDAEMPMTSAITLVPTATAFITPRSEMINPSIISTPIPDKHIEVVYQEFEYGFMLWDVAKDCAYAYREDSENGIIIPDSLEKEYSPGNSYMYCLPEPAERRPDPIVNVPSRLHIPDENIGLIWKAYPEVRDGVGFAIGKQHQYIGSVPYEGVAITLVCCNVAALPDGRVLQCGFYGHSARRCSIFDAD